MLWEHKLMLISDVIEEWLAVQRNWQYLENIFSTSEIQSQLPIETAKFNQVDKFWEDLMNKTKRNPLVIDNCLSEDLLSKLKINHAVLDEIYLCLQFYLETKRIAFPRFYFVSNDELLKILSETRNPLMIQSDIRKLFDCINNLCFSPEDKYNTTVEGF